MHLAELIRRRRTMALEPQPCQYHDVTYKCIRCGSYRPHKSAWVCKVQFYGPGDVLFRLFRFFNLPQCRGCRWRQQNLNLWWFWLRGSRYV